MLATQIAVYGLLITPLGWGWAQFVSTYALAWFLVTDPVKLLAYRMPDPAKNGSLGSPSDRAAGIVAQQAVAVGLVWKCSPFTIIR